MSENLIPAVVKAVMLLERLGQSPRGATQAELRQELQLSPSTCYRLIQTLLATGWIRKIPDSRYDLAGGLLTAARKLLRQTANFETAQPLLERLAAATGLAVKLSVRQNDEQLTLLRAESPRPTAVSARAGCRFPLIEGSVGAALLACSAPEEIARLVRRCPEDIIEKQQPELIRKRLTALRDTGYCFNAVHNRWRIDALSVPVAGDGGGVAAALTLLGTDEDFRPELMPATVRALQNAAAELQQHIQQESQS